MSSWIPPIVSPFNTAFTLSEGVRAILDVLRTLRDGLLGIRTKILENRKQILEAIRKIITEGNKGISQDDLNKIESKLRNC